MKNILVLLMFINLSLFAQRKDTHQKVRLIATDSVDASTVNKVLAFDDLTKEVVFVSKTSIGGGGNQFTADQANELLALIYENYTASFSVSPNFGERGVNVSYSINYNIVSNDDVITSASINQSIGNVTGDVDDGFNSITGESSTTTKTYQLTVNYTRNSTPGTGIHNSTYTSYVPQWAGYSSTDDFTGDYSVISSESNFQKYVQNSTSITKTNFSPTGEYIWFISSKNNATIKDGNDFTQTIGTWGDGVSEFYLKPITLTLADGTTTAIVFLYRSRNVKSLPASTFKIL